MRIVIATTNNGKTREYRELLKATEIELVGLDAFPPLREPAEDGATFRENAEFKARSYAEQVGEWVLADDSGLEVAALNGAPGVHSARFGGDVGYPEKIALLLEEIKDAADRSARFVCVISIARADGSAAATAVGECKGSIALEPSGSNGFGYDPVFIPEGFDRTFGEMSDAEKRSLSHRARAADEIIRKMLDFIGV